MSELQGIDDRQIYITNNFKYTQIKLNKLLFLPMSKTTLQTIDNTVKLEKAKTLQQLSYGPGCTKDTSLFRKIVPIKQYSNKFFRRHKNSQFKQIQQITQRPTKQKRVNSLMRKQKIFQSPAIRSQSSHISACINNGSMIAISSFSNAKPKMRVKTEVAKNNISFQNGQTSVIQIEQELILSNDFNKKLISPSATFLMKSNDEFFDFKAQFQSIQLKKQVRKNKISQSRGLEKYCKIFIKEKSEIVQKLWENKRKITKTVDQGIYSENENHFETKKLIPIEKSKKMKTLETYYCKKGMRTPMRTIDNDEVTGRLQTLNDLKNNYNDEYFEINGWETSL